MFMIDLGTPSHYALLGVAPTATAAEIRKARDDMVLWLRKEARREQTPERKAELAEREQAVNAAAEVLARPARREEYDQEHPDLQLFTVRSAAAPLFTDPAQRISVLYQALIEHLAGLGARTRPLSDLYRTDFTTDETPNQLLDDLIAQRRL
ncbi:MAG: DnaJ domain-containing protein [Actinobacteria bacterium]|nr:DnaJ domain-containing protein [Actinomycetota bacterium]